MKKQAGQYIFITLLALGLVIMALIVTKQQEIIYELPNEVQMSEKNDSDLAGGTMLAGEEIPPGSEGLIGGDAMPPGENPEDLPIDSARPDSWSLKNIEYSYVLPPNITVKHGDGDARSLTVFYSETGEVFRIGVASSVSNVPQEITAGIEPISFDEFLAERGISLTGHSVSFGEYEFVEAVRAGEVIYLAYFEDYEFPFVVELPAVLKDNLAGVQISESLEFILR